jgi:hypothetical protein
MATGNQIARFLAAIVAVVAAMAGTLVISFYFCIAVDIFLNRGSHDSQGGMSGALVGIFIAPCLSVAAGALAYYLLSRKATS